MPRIAKAAVAGALIIGVTSVCGAQSAGSASLAPTRSAFSASIVSPTDTAEARVPDTFLGYDKVKHFMMSGFIEAIGFNALQAANVDRGASLGAATAVTLGIGIARELHDHKTKGLFSLGDLTWDTLGTAAALLIFSHSQR